MMHNNFKNTALDINSNIMMNNILFNNKLNSNINEINENEILVQFSAVNIIPMLIKVNKNINIERLLKKFLNEFGIEIKYYINIIFIYNDSFLNIKNKTKVGKFFLNVQSPNITIVDSEGILNQIINVNFKSVNDFQFILKVNKNNSFKEFCEKFSKRFGVYEKVIQKDISFF